ncbi:tRNA 2-selenouridine(34) synthase MnmH [Mesobacterium sp. TK19101]|uniref:tRNA 2-selenouridine(34) synthase MnmH n=1 Tax=Mesobacterium hydrothermale TaxID=3111907 RepID=A0ABU6HL66_9RHOB|nr:tRNA 2-selenouridine(34) synthase MnmH [Mesobacterium sp. TK19101]MEC3863041.1 tRNA 2-selenouridine(34) synthase MnmH [Mesobacterium sp. TK19101]
MPQTFNTPADLLNHGFDTVIDVRSPAEFAEDHIPGAINLPVLDNEERARVGTLYKQVSPFTARKLGAALVFRNAAAHVEGPLAHHEGDWRPLVYCWRGGQRSGSFAWMLGQIGWRSDTIAGGYQTYRRLVYRALYEAPIAQRVILLDGFTGTAKTEVLHRVATLGAQVLDLEGLANHRGSLLGRMGDQPSQKAFESDIACALARMDPARPVLVEAESNKVGARIVPPSLWKAMCAAPRIEVTATLEARSAYLLQAYADVLTDGDRLRENLTPLRHFRGHEVVDRWFALIEAGDKPGLTRALMEDHYDPAYSKSRTSIGAACMAEVDAGALDGPALDRAAQAVLRIMDQTIET